MSVINPCEAGAEAAVIHNRPALPRIGYRIGGYPEFRATMFRALDRSDALQAYTHRGADDPGIALIEGAAIVCDVLTFYQELYANELFLRTATWQTSVEELVRLLGYRLAPGLGADALFALVADSEDPITVPAGTAFKIALEDVDSPPTFETKDDVSVHPALGVLRLFTPFEEASIVDATARIVLFGDGATEIEEGERLLFGVRDAADASKLSDAQTLAVKEVIELHGQAVVTLEGSIQLTASSQDELSVYRLGRSFRHFGHNSPSQYVYLSGSTATAETVSYDRQLDDQTGTGIDYIDPEFPAKAFPLDQEVDDFAAGSPFLIQLTSNDLVAVRTAVRARSRTLRWGSLSTSSTVVTVNQQVGGILGTEVDVRDLTLHETLGGPYDARAYPTELGGNNRSLLIESDAADALALLDRRIAWIDDEGDWTIATVVQVEEESAGAARWEGLHRLTLDVDVDRSSFPHDPDLEEPIDVYANLVDATEGASESATIIGTGNAGLAFQSFELPSPPLTYLRSADESPPEVPELEIRVNGQAWTRMAYFYAQDPDAQVYVVREDEDGTSFVQFGDGATGARLPSGVDNVVAVYRTGSGASGPAEQGASVQIKSDVDGLDEAFMVGVASGGSAREELETAREAAPGRVQSLGRVVSLRDVETESLAISGVRTVRARMTQMQGAPVITVHVLMESGREDEIDAVSEIIKSLSRCRGGDRFTIVVSQAFEEYLYLDVVYALSSGAVESVVTPLIENALGLVTDDADPETEVPGLFDPRTRRIGERELATRISGTIQQVEGVAWARSQSFGSLGTSDEPDTLIMPSSPLNGAVVTPGSGNVLRLRSGPDQGLLVISTTFAEEGGCDD